MTFVLKIVVVGIEKRLNCVMIRNAHSIEIAGQIYHIKIIIKIWNPKMMIKSFPKTYLEFSSWFSDVKEFIFSFDTETTGLRIDCEIKGFSLSDGQKACYVNLENNLEKSLILHFLGEVLGNTKLLIMHNATFDLRILKINGITYQNCIYDTMVATHLLNENDSCGLKEVAKRRKYPDADNPLKWKDAVVNGYSSELFLNYAIQDAIWTWMLYEETHPLLHQQGFDKLFYDIEMPFQFVLVDLYIQGIEIDLEKLEDFDDTLSGMKVLAEEECVKTAGLKMIEDKTLFGITLTSSPINLNSDQQVANLVEVLTKKKLPRTEPSSRFPEGQPSTTSEVLEPLKDKHPFVKALLKYRKIGKTLNTFIRPLFRLVDKDDRLRTDFNDCIARTGRLSSSHPNLQNIPKVFSKDDVVNVRELFRAKAGYKFIKADYDSQELRQLANVTGDDGLVDAFNTNKDLHLKTANGCLSLGLREEQLRKTNPDYDSLKKKFEKERHIGKNGINFPIIYGSSAYGVAYNNQVSVEVAEKWQGGFFKLYPKVKESIAICKKELFRNHYVKTYFGRKRRFRVIDKKAIRQAFNHWIQGMCADLLRLTLIRIKDLLDYMWNWDAHIVLTVHDDVIIEIKEEFADECKQWIKAIMEETVDLPVKFLVDVEICDTYAG